MKLRKSNPNMNRPFKVKTYKVVGSMVIGMSGLLCVVFGSQIW